MTPSFPVKGTKTPCRFCSPHMGVLRQHRHTAPATEGAAPLVITNLNIPVNQSGAVQSAQAASSIWVFIGEPAACAGGRRMHRVKDECRLLGGPAVSPRCQAGLGLWSPVCGRCWIQETPMGSQLLDAPHITNTNRHTHLSLQNGGTCCQTHRLSGRPALINPTPEAPARHVNRSGRSGPRSASASSMRPSSCRRGPPPSGTCRVCGRPGGTGPCCCSAGHCWMLPTRNQSL